jgi:hypothetical protein
MQVPTLERLTDFRSTGVTFISGSLRLPCLLPVLLLSGKMIILLQEFRARRRLLEETEGSSKTKEVYFVCT